jgi:flagellar biogenesis protein FliO
MAYALNVKEGGQKMIVFPAFVSTATIIGVLLPILLIPVAIILLVVWLVKRLNSMDRTLKEILEKLKAKD